MNYAAAIISAREHAGLSKRALARKVGVDPSYITHLEAGRRVPSLQLLEELARACGVAPLDVHKLAAGELLPANARNRLLVPASPHAQAFTEVVEDALRWALQKAGLWDGDEATLGAQLAKLSPEQRPRLESYPDGGVCVTVGGFRVWINPSPTFSDCLGGHSPAQLGSGEQQTPPRSDVPLSRTPHSSTQDFQACVGCRRDS